MAEFDKNDVKLHVEGKMNGEKTGSSETESNGDKKKENEKPKQVGAFEVFRFADGLDIFCMLVGTLCACCHGVGMPALLILFGKMTDSFTDSAKFSFVLDQIISFLQAVGLTKDQCIGNPDVLRPYISNLSIIINDTETISIIQKQIDNSLLDTMKMYSYYLIGLAGIVWILGYFQAAFWSLAAERQSHRIRVTYFRSIMQQDVGWFDTHETEQLSTRLSDDINKIHEGIGDKIANFFQYLSAFFAGFIIGFVYGWKLTLVILSVSPILAVSASIFNKILTSMTTKELAAYAKAGAIAEEVLGAIRTVIAFGGQEKACQRYNGNLVAAKSFGIKKAISNGISVGVVFFLVFCIYALGFWYAGKLTRDEPENYTIGTALIIFFCVVVAAFSIGHALPNMQDYAVARGAAYTIYGVIDQTPTINNKASRSSTNPPSLQGNITLKNIHFRYPAREEVKVLNGVNLEVRKGQTVALVGASGCGKSTIIQLMQRFYDPEDGKVCVDGKDIKELNLEWIRKQIGVVSQEPVLFATTIAENIKFGNPNVTYAEVEKAAKMANAHNFIMDLPKKYETLVGDRGAQLSGGQKQRIAIARALVRDPKILLLDEATSALDTESESIVQEALDKARAGRTTIVVAHRLSTIKTADIIAGFKDGVIVEQGTHEELMKNHGVYYDLVTLQHPLGAGTKNVDEEEEQIIEEYIGSPTKHKLKSQMSIQPAVSAKDEDGESDDKKKKEKEPEGSFKRIIRLSSPEWYFILSGCLGSLLMGGIQPTFAIIFSNILGVFGSTDEDYQKKEIAIYVCVFIGIGATAFLANLMMGYSFGKVGENLTMRLRKAAFKAMLRQEVAYFDDEKNSLGALTTRLATEASQVHGAAGARLGMVLQSLANIGTALVIGFIYGWKLTLVILGFVPLMAISGAVRLKMLTGMAGKNKKALEGAGKIATESIENIRTVYGLTLEDKMLQLYCDSLESPYKQALRRHHVTGVVFGFSQGVIFLAYAASFYFGAYLIQNNEMTFTNVMRVFSAIVFGGMALGQASSFAPDASKAKVAAGHIFALLDRKPLIDSESTEGEKPVGISSAMQFQHVSFRYPNRSDVQVLQGLSLTIEPGKTLALVGASGCGKSTTMQLIERFYDPEKGTVKLDIHDIRDLNVQWLRSKIGIVSQEPVLFDCSIAENIAYGDNSRVVPMDEIISAARSANIHNFISTLPTGYDTMVGSKGTQLSGGQKQRVAIARALVRDPKILLLDEATSALDTESEKIVQEALDKAREGRTCIVIAHRLSTIRNADKICVIKHGEVVEEGRHGDLMSKQGIYYKLNNASVAPV